ncbi:hypothetical protein GCM10022254_32150 [Actinomadura meridiana]|uniref:Uncharacterized protein n=1 Tax=Actinomadura meridiana TaxID=559626 RepID=A0ABP8C2B0_9ACTN
MFTHTRIGPNARSTSPAAHSTWSGSATSTVRGSADPPRSSASAAAASSPARPRASSLAHAFPCTFADAIDSASGTFTDAPRRSARAFPHISHRPTRALADVLHCSARAATDVLCRATRALTHVLHCSARALADAPRRSARAFPHISYRAARALAHVLYRAARALAHGLHRSARAATDVLDGAPGAPADLAHGGSGPGADVAGRRLDAASDVLEDLRVAVQRRQDAVDDDGHVVQPDVQPRLCLHALDLQLDLAEGHVRADAQPEHVEDLGDERDVRFQVLDLKGDLVDLEQWHVKVDVRLFARRVVAHRRPRSLLRVVTRSAVHAVVRDSHLGWSVNRARRRPSPEGHNR